jgi:hypothetical protein
MKAETVWKSFPASDANMSRINSPKVTTSIFRSYPLDKWVFKDRLVGYDYVISIEHEDAMMSRDEGLANGVALLKNVLMAEAPGKMYWTQPSH